MVMIALNRYVSTRTPVPPELLATSSHAHVHHPNKIKHHARPRRTSATVPLHTGAGMFKAGADSCAGAKDDRSAGEATTSGRVSAETRQA